MENEVLIFFALMMLMYIIMYFGGRSMQKAVNNQDYWKRAIVPISAFTLNMGMRWGRGVDYNNLYYGFHNIIAGIYESDREPIWIATNKIMGHLTGANWQLTVAFFSCFLIVSVIYFLKDHKSILPYALPLFAFFTFPSENLVRWFYAFSFYLLALPNMIPQETKWYSVVLNKRYLIFSICAFFTHYGFVLVIVYFTIFLTIRKPIITPLFAIIAFYLVLVFSDINQFAFLAGFIERLNLVSRFQAYQDNATEWLTNNIGDYSGSLTGTAFFTIPIVIYFSYKLVTAYHRELIPYYNLLTVILVFFPLLVQIQLMYRIALIAYVFQFLFIPYIVIERRNLLIRSTRSKLSNVLMFVLILFTLRSMVVMPLVKTHDEVLYVWDANGRKTLF